MKKEQFTQRRLDADVSDVILSDDAKRRGLEEAGFKIICDCGQRRRFMFTKKTWNIMPCPYCKMAGVTNEYLS